MITLLVECKREHTPYVLLRYDNKRSRLTLEYGHVDLAQFKALTREALSLDEFEELRSLHDGKHWNWNQVWSLVHDAEDAAIEMPMRVYLEGNAHRSKSIIYFSAAV